MYVPEALADSVREIGVAVFCTEYYTKNVTVMMTFFFPGAKSCEWHGVSKNLAEAWRAFAASYKSAKDMPDTYRHAGFDFFRHRHTFSL